VLQDLDPSNGEITPLLSGDVNGYPLKWLNYVLVDSAGALWCSVSTASDDLLDTIARGTADGYIFRVAPDRSSREAAELADERRVGRRGYARCVHRLDRDAVRPQRAKFGTRDADGPPKVTSRNAFESGSTQRQPLTYHW
jgi:hypothetical protein